MSRSRHEMKKRASGGGLSSEPKWNAGGEQNAAKEAEERKRGGKVHQADGEHAKKRMDRKERARGGALNKPDTGALAREEEKDNKEKSNPEELKRGGKTRGRARGGGIGADRTPLTTAAKVKHVTSGELAEEGVPSD